MTKSDKRKSESQDADVDEKMDRFYELIRCYNESRCHYHQQCCRSTTIAASASGGISHHSHHLHNQQEGGGGRKKLKMASINKQVKYNGEDCEEESKGPISWNLPSFKWEDFGEGDYQDSPSPNPNPSNRS